MMQVQPHGLSGLHPDPKSPRYCISNGHLQISKLFQFSQLITFIKLKIMVKQIDFYMYILSDL